MEERRPHRSGTSPRLLTRGGRERAMSLFMKDVIFQTFVRLSDDPINSLPFQLISDWDGSSCKDNRGNVLEIHCYKLGCECLCVYGKFKGLKCGVRFIGNLVRDR